VEAVAILQHKRPLWIGLLACATTPPAVYCLIALLRLPFLIVSAQAGPILGLIFLVGLIFSLAMTFSLGLLVVLFLRKIFRLNALLVCAAGAVAGALFAFLVSRVEEGSTAVILQVQPPSMLNVMTLEMMEKSALVGLLAAVVLCFVSGIPIRSVRLSEGPSRD
jgi:hypothetical protein